MLRSLAMLLACAWCFAAHAADGWNGAFTTPGGTRVGLAGNVQYDAVAFHDDGGRGHAHDFRRRDVGFTIKGRALDVVARYDFESRAWQDVALRVASSKLLSRDLGTLRLGYFKTPVGMSVAGSASVMSFLEAPLPTQAVYEGRRTGVEWSLSKPSWQASAAYYVGQTIEDAAQGTTLAARGAWTPRSAAGDVWHLGLAYSQERPDADTARVRVNPEVSLGAERLVDTGILVGVDRIDRGGFEFIRIRGPLAVVAEVLQSDFRRADGLREVRVHGATAYATWVVTGESRSYAGSLGNLVPNARSGAVELLLRYSTLDLVDAGVDGGRERNWTLGANYYVGEHFKLQVNYVDARARRQGVDREIDALQARAQLYF